MNHGMESMAIRIAEVLKKYQMPELWQYAIASVTVDQGPVSPGMQWRNFPNQVKAAVITESFAGARLNVILLPVGSGNFSNQKEGSSDTYLFTESEVNQYLHQTGDDNPIHAGTQAIVPGLLILSFLEKNSIQKTLTYFSVRFYSALLVNEKFEISQTETNQWEVRKSLNDPVLTLKLE